MWPQAERRVKLASGQPAVMLRTVRNGYDTYWSSGSHSPCTLLPYITVQYPEPNRVYVGVIVSVPRIGDYQILDVHSSRWVISNVGVEMSILTGIMLGRYHSRVDAEISSSEFTVNKDAGLVALMDVA